MGSTDNDKITSRLQAARRAVVKFLDNSKPFDLGSLKAVRRSCVVNAQGFVLRVEGEVLSMDPTIDKWLLKTPWPAFRLKHGGVYARQLDEHTLMVIFNANANASQRWKIGYEISIPIRPWVPRASASASELESFVLGVLWPQAATLRTREWHRKQL